MLDQIILGAGPSGLSYSLIDDNRTLIIEKNSYPGGHASSYFIDGFTFDYGPHIIFSKDRAILDFIVNSLADNVHACKRNNKVSFKDKLIKYPFENDLSSLGYEDNFECIKTFLFNKYKEIYKEPRNMKEWFYFTFGSGISEKYLIPYNEKVWNIPVDKLSMVWAERIPNPPPEDVLKSSIGIPTEGYLHQLYYNYPKTGGYQAISNAWAKNCNINYNESVIEINKNNEFFDVLTSKGKYKVKEIISTINLSSLFNVCAKWIPADIVDAYKKLIVNPMYVISIGLKGFDENQYTAIYFADSDFLVNRISFPCTFSSLNAPKGFFSIQAEITYKKNDPIISNMSDEEIKEHVLDGLKKRKIIKNEEVILVDLKRISESYVVYDIDYERNAKIVRDFFAASGIELVGRFSYFEYVNIDMAVNRSIETFIRKSKTKKSKEMLLNQALEHIFKNDA
jgi:protoporphyrinogen oxidase